MTSHKRFAVSLAVFALLASNAMGKDLPNIDTLFNSKVKPNISATLEQKVGRLNKDGLAIQGEERLGVPTFLWLDPTQLSGHPAGNGADVG